jgi:hypothetical protein
MNGAAEFTPYPAIPASVAAAHPALANRNNVCQDYWRRLNEALRAFKAAEAAAGPQRPQHAIGSSPIPAHSALVSHIASGSTSAAGVGVSVVTLPGGQDVAVPAGLAGDELEDYVVERYGEANRPSK